MIVRLVGRLLEKQPNHVVLDVRGVGYQAWITLNAFERLPELGDEVTLLIHHQMREDGQELFGFLEREEREVFTSLLSISGIGGKTAITILSGARPEDFRRRVQTGDEEALTTIKGVGPKMARRIITELRDRYGAIGESDWESLGPLPEGVAADTLSQAIRSLVTLGYKYPDARRAVQAALKRTGAQPAVEELIRAALSGS